MDFNLGLTGYPLGHSLSPFIHKAALDSFGLGGSYSLFSIHPQDHQGLKDLLACVRSGEIAGLNVTIPYKQTVIPLLDALTPMARAIGAVNTIFGRNGRLIGDNTDAPGFLADLHRFLTTEARRTGRPVRGGLGQGPFSTAGQGGKRSVLVFGAGGSARAVVYALANDGWKVTIAARRLEQAQDLIDQYSIPGVRFSMTGSQNAGLHSLIRSAGRGEASDFSLAINTTPLGMSPDIDSSPWPENLPFPANIAIYDLVYNPRETKLVQDARAAGLSATSGLGMLIEQAALAFSVWTGQTPPREILWDAVDLAY